MTHSRYSGCRISLDSSEDNDITSSSAVSPHIELSPLLLTATTTTTAVHSMCLSLTEHETHKLGSIFRGELPAIVNPSHCSLCDLAQVFEVPSFRGIDNELAPFSTVLE